MPTVRHLADATKRTNGMHSIMNDESSTPEFNSHSVMRWHVLTEPSHNFARHETHLWIAGRAQGDTYILKPTVLEFSLMSEGVSTRDQPSLIVPNELGQALTEALVTRYVATDAGNVVTRIRELERQRDKAVSQLDALIAGIGRAGRIGAS